ncbi:MAG: NADH-quinone oxidoreductase subunit K [Candidatus Omnitrophica bacterium]|nr:NADH-quinone oxidoreductase subunit K [Candidatus Omnitrophota bacterium]
MIYLLCFILFCIGLYCILAKKNLIKIIIGISIIDYSLYLFLILIGYRMQGRSPIHSPVQRIENMVDPLPQALVLTAIVIGLAVLALLISIAVRLYDKYGTFDITKIRKLRG